MLKTGLLLFASLLAGCSVVCPSGDFVAGEPLICGETVARYSMPPPCPASVGVCLRSCEPMCPAGGQRCLDACQGDCLAGRPECVQCIVVDSVECVNRQGCQSKWDDYDCCLAATCGVRAIDANQEDPCVMTECLTEAITFSRCSDDPMVSTQCDATVVECFQLDVGGG